MWYWLHFIYFHSIKMHFELSFAKRLSFCLGLNVLRSSLLASFRAQCSSWTTQVSTNHANVKTVSSKRVCYFYPKYIISFAYQTSHSSLKKKTHQHQHRQNHNHNISSCIIFIVDVIIVVVIVLTIIVFITCIVIIITCMSITHLSMSNII